MSDLPEDRKDDEAAAAPDAAATEEAAKAEPADKATDAPGVITTAGGEPAIITQVVEPVDLETPPTQTSRDPEEVQKEAEAAAVRDPGAATFDIAPGTVVGAPADGPPPVEPPAASIDPTFPGEPVAPTPGDAPGTEPDGSQTKDPAAAIEGSTQEASEFRPAGRLAGVDPNLAEGGPITPNTAEGQREQAGPQGGSNTILSNVEADSAEATAASEGKPDEEKTVAELAAELGVPSVGTSNTLNEVEKRDAIDRLTPAEKAEVAEDLRPSALVEAPPASDLQGRSPGRDADREAREEAAAAELNRPTESVDDRDAVARAELEAQTRADEARQRDIDRGEATREFGKALLGPKVRDPNGKPGEPARRPAAQPSIGELLVPDPVEEDATP